MWALLPEGEDLVVDIHISDTVRKCVDACAKKAFRILKPENMGRDSKTVRVGFVDDCTVEGWGQPLVLPTPVVDPDFDEIHLLCRQLADGGSCFFLARDPMWDLRTTGFRCGDTAPGALGPRTITYQLVPHLERHISRVQTQAQHRTGTVIRHMLNLIGPGLSLRR